MSTSPSELRVLIVDDDHDVLAANARFLRVNGLNVTVANQAASAIERLQEEPVDVIVTDLVMPGDNGIALARSARELLPFVPILFFSGYARVPDVVAAMRLGAVDFLEKPVEPEELLERLIALADTPDGVSQSRAAFDLSDAMPFRARVLAYERYLIETSLAQHHGKIADVLEALKINRRTLNEKMARLGIKRDGSDPS